MTADSDRRPPGESEPPSSDGDPLDGVVAARGEIPRAPAPRVAHGALELTRMLARAAGIATVLLLGTGLTAAQLVVVDATTPVEPRLPSVVVSGVVSLVVVTTVVWTLGAASGRLGRRVQSEFGRR